MAGTKEGGKKSRDSNYAIYGPNYYRRIGQLGGKAGKGPMYSGGFAGSRELASRAGRLGGLISRRGKGKVKTDEKDELLAVIDEEFEKEKMRKLWQTEANKTNAKVARRKT